MTLIIFLRIFYWITKARKVITLHSRKWCKASTVTEAPCSREKKTSLFFLRKGIYASSSVNVRYIRLSMHRAGFHCGSREEAIEFNCCAHSLASANKTRIFVASNSLGPRMYERSLRLTAAKLISFLGR